MAVTVPQFLLAPHLLADSDLTLVLPCRVAEVGARPLGLAVRDLPEGGQLVQRQHGQAQASRQGSGAGLAA